MKVRVYATKEVDFEEKEDILSRKKQKNKAKESVKDILEENGFENIDIFVRGYY